MCEKRLFFSFPVQVVRKWNFRNTFCSRILFLINRKNTRKQTPIYEWGLAGPPPVDGHGLVGFPWFSLVVLGFVSPPPLWMVGCPPPLWMWGPLALLLLLPLLLLPLLGFPCFSAPSPAGAASPAQAPAEHNKARTHNEKQ